MNTYIKQALTDQIDQLLADPLALLHYADRMTDNQLLALVETMDLTRKDASNPPEAFRRSSTSFQLIIYAKWFVIIRSRLYLCVNLRPTWQVILCNFLLTIKSRFALGGLFVIHHFYLGMWCGQPSLDRKDIPDFESVIGVLWAID